MPLFAAAPYYTHAAAAPAAAALRCAPCRAYAIIDAAMLPLRCCCHDDAIYMPFSRDDATDAMPLIRARARAMLLTPLICRAIFRYYAIRYALLMICFLLLLYGAQAAQRYDIYMPYKEQMIRLY